MPGWLSRIAARAGIGVRASGWGGGLDAAGTGRRMRGFVAVRSHVNSLVQASGSTVLARARYLRRNNAYAANAAESFRTAAVGAGIKPSWRLADGAMKATLQARWLAWTDEADVDGVSDYYGLQSRVADELFTAGECFIRMRPDRDGVLRLQLLPSEMLDPSYTLDLAGDNPIRSGIEFDRDGRRVAYHFWREHPGDATLGSLSGERVRIPADEVIHVHDPAEAGQLRGLPRLTPSVVKLWMLDVYDDAELERKKTAALFAVFVTRPGAEGDGAIGPTTQAVDASGAAVPGVGEAALEPGTVQFLDAGEDVEVAAPADVGGSYEAFQYRTLAQVCAGLGLPYSAVTGDVLKANYSNMRAALIEARRRMERVQHGVLIFQMDRRVANAWLDAEVLAGRLQLPGYGSDPTPWRSVKWIPPRVEWIDPLKDRQADLAAVRAGFRSLSHVIEAEGYDVEEVLDEIAATNAMIDARDLVLDSDPRRVSQTGLAQTDEPPEADQDQDQLERVR